MLESWRLLQICLFLRSASALIEIHLIRDPSLLTNVQQVLSFLGDGQSSTSAQILQIAPTQLGTHASRFHRKVFRDLIDSEFSDSPLNSTRSVIGPIADDMLSGYWSNLDLYWDVSSLEPLPVLFSADPLGKSQSDHLSSRASSLMMEQLLADPALTPEGASYLRANPLSLTFPSTRSGMSLSLQPSLFWSQTVCNVTLDSNIEARLSAYVQRVGKFKLQHKIDVSPVFYPMMVIPASDCVSHTAEAFEFLTQQSTPNFSSTWPFHGHIISTPDPSAEPNPSELDSQVFMNVVDRSNPSAFFIALDLYFRSNWSQWWLKYRKSIISSLNDRHSAPPQPDFTFFSVNSSMSLLPGLTTTSTPTFTAASDLATLQSASLLTSAINRLRALSSFTSTLHTSLAKLVPLLLASHTQTMCSSSMIYCTTELSQLTNLIESSFPTSLPANFDLLAHLCSQKSAISELLSASGALNSRVIPPQSSPFWCNSTHETLTELLVDTRVGQALLDVSIHTLLVRLSASHFSQDCWSSFTALVQCQSRAQQLVAAAIDSSLQPDSMERALTDALYPISEFFDSGTIEMLQSINLADILLGSALHATRFNVQSQVSPDEQWQHLASRQTLRFVVGVTEFEGSTKSLSLCFPVPDSLHVTVENHPNAQLFGGQVLCIPQIHVPPLTTQYLVVRATTGSSPALTSVLPLVAPPQFLSASEWSDERLQWSAPKANDFVLTTEYQGQSFTVHFDSQCGALKGFGTRGRYDSINHRISVDDQPLLCAQIEIYTQNAAVHRLRLQCAIPDGTTFFVDYSVSFTTTALRIPLNVHVIPRDSFSVSSRIQHQFSVDWFKSAIQCGLHLTLFLGSPHVSFSLQMHHHPPHLYAQRCACTTFAPSLPLAPLLCNPLVAAKPPVLRCGLCTILF